MRGDLKKDDLEESIVAKYLELISNEGLANQTYGFIARIEGFTFIKYARELRNKVLKSYEVPFNRIGYMQNKYFKANVLTDFKIIVCMLMKYQLKD